MNKEKFSFEAMSRRLIDDCSRGEGGWRGSLVSLTSVSQIVGRGGRGKTSGGVGRGSGGLLRHMTGNN